MKAAGKGMKSKRTLKAAVCLICSILLAMSLNPAFAIASTEPTHDSSQVTGGSQSASTDSSSQDKSLVYDGRVFNDGDKGYRIEEVNLADIQPSKTISLSSTTSTSLGLKDTNEINWIDRIAFPDEFESTFKEFYKMLKESCDNDGDRDFLIKDKYFKPGVIPEESKEKGFYQLLVTGIHLTALKIGSFDYSYDDFETKKELFRECADATLAAFDRDCPKVFWIANNIHFVSYPQVPTGELGELYLIIGGGENSEYDVRSTVFSSEEDVKNLIKMREQKIQKILAGVGKSYSIEGEPTDSIYLPEDVQYTDTEIVRIFNRQLTYTNSYNSSENLDVSELPLAFECISALEGNIGEDGPVCEGYARAFKVLCDAAKINCVLTDGLGRSSKNRSEPHMWNYVEIDGSWYGVDVTWNDPGTTAKAKSGYEHEGYLLVGSNTITSSIISDLVFIDTHIVENIHFDNGLKFLNGPVLSKTAFVFDDKDPLSTSNAASLDSAQIDLEDKEFTKQPIIQSNIKVSLNGVTVQNRNYVYECINNVNPGQAEVRVYGRGNYFGTASAPFTINKVKAEVKSISVASVTYNGEAQEPKPNIELTNPLLKEGEDYSVTTTYTNNVNVGTANAKVVIRGINSCEGEIVKNLTFTIKPANIGSATATATDMVYTGKAITPKITIKMANQSLVQGTHYSASVAWSNNKNVGKGTATITIKGIGNYTGTIKCTASFKINPKKMKISKLLSKKKSFVVKWAKAAKAWCTGYQIRYSTNSKLKSGVKTSTVKKYSTAQTTIKKLKKKKNYYVQIRAYKTVGGTKYYGDWSIAKKVRTK